MTDTGASGPVLPARLAHLRAERGWSQAVLAQHLGTDAPQVTRYETGKVTPSTATVVRLAEVFGVTTDYLLRDHAPRMGTPGPPPGTPGQASAGTSAERLVGCLRELEEGDLELVAGLVEALASRRRAPAPRRLRTSPYPADLRERAVRQVRQTARHSSSEQEAIASVAADLGIGSAETVRRWVRQSAAS